MGLLKDFYEKRKDKPLKEANWFLVDMLDEPGVRRIVDKKIMELMLCDGFGLIELENAVFAKRQGWHIGKDDKVYERFTISEIGEWYYENQNIKERSANFIPALEELNKGKILGKYLQEKVLIEEICFRRHGVKSITKYEGKELDRPKEEKQEKQEQAPKTL